VFVCCLITSAVSAINNLYITLGAPSLHHWLAFGGDPCGEKWQGVVCDSSNITEMYTSSSALVTLCYGLLWVTNSGSNHVNYCCWMQKDTWHEGRWRLKWYSGWFFIYPSHVSKASCLVFFHLHLLYEASCYVKNMQDVVTIDYKVWL